MGDLPSWLADALRGRYALERELGRGGMATVYLARDLKHDRPVALKVLLPELAASVGPDRFQREIKLAARLQHPHILSVHDSGDAAGRLWFTMPYVEGESLRARLVREGPLPIDGALRIIREAAEALQYAHEHGVIHRDIKPENLLLTLDGNTLVADFGIARGFGAGDDQLTATGLAVGTPRYMSPEQAAGDRGLDGRADLYSLACVLYEMLIGHPPFLGATAAEVFARHALDPVPPLRTSRPQIPERIERAVTRALAKAPADRFPTVGSFSAALEAAPSDTLASPVHRPRFRLAAYVGGVLVLAAALALWWVGRAQRAITSAVPEASKSDLPLTLAVLPFASGGGRPDQQYLSDGLTEMLIASLGNLKQLRVITWSSVLAYKGSGKSEAEIARELGAVRLLEGSVTPVGSNLQLRARLIDPRSDKLVWDNAYDREESELAGVTTDLTDDIARALRIPVASDVQRRLARRPTASARAYQEFLRATYFQRRFNQLDLDSAIVHYERAIAADSTFALAYASLARAYEMKYDNYSPQKKWQERAFVASETALALDSTVADAHAAKAFLIWTAENHFPQEAAAAECKRAIALRPSLDIAHDGLALIYAHVGLLDRALEESQLTAVLDPTGFGPKARIAQVLLYQQRYAAALEIFRRLPESYAPSFMAAQTAAALLRQGRVTDGRALVERRLRELPKDPWLHGIESALLAASGDATGAAAHIRVAAEHSKGLAHVHHVEYDIGVAYALLRRPNQALEWLTRAADDGFPCYPVFRDDPELAPLHGDPGFVALLGRLKVEWQRYAATL